GINVVITAHAQMRKFEQPDEMGAYDRWELKLEKKTSALVKEWADIVLFANYKTIVVNVDNQGAQKGKNKAQGGARVMYATHHPCWDAKNRNDLPDELPFVFAAIAYLFTAVKPAAQKVQTPPQQIPDTTADPVNETEPVAASEPDPAVPTTEALDEKIPKALRDLMQVNNVSVADIQTVVGQKGYYPQDTPIENYDSNFIAGVLIGAWDQVYDAICLNTLPFKT
ncbi:MAG: AAA family ATPase, partial [Candidatus Neomarinimicrobiota bacterium]